MLEPESTFTSNDAEASRMQLSSDQESICSNYANEEKGKLLCKIMNYEYYILDVGGTGRWSSDNCRKIRSGGGRTICDCSQLGHFGLLFVRFN